MFIKKIKIKRTLIDKVVILTLDVSSFYHLQNLSFSPIYPRKRRKLMRVVIIGGNDAGMAAAMHLRRIDDRCEIIILETSNEFAVSTCGLPYLVGRKVADPQALIGASPEQIKKLFHIEVRLNVEIKKIDANKKIITFQNNKTLSYHNLILAGWCRHKPRIKGVDQSWVLDASCLKDVSKLTKLKPQKALIVGDGFLSLRLAEALLKQKVEVTLATPKKYILSDFDKDFAEMVQHKLPIKKIMLLPQISPATFLDKHVVFNDGRTGSFDLALLLPVETSAVNLPITPPLKTGFHKKFVVDERMKTSAEDVFACSQLIEYQDILTQRSQFLTGPALSSLTAKAAADSVCGHISSFGKILKNQIVKVFDYYIGQTGCTEYELKNAGIPYHILYLSQMQAEVYLKEATPLNAKFLFGNDGRILGLQLLGKHGVHCRINIIAALIMCHTSVYQLEKFPIAYFPELSLAKDMLNNLGSLAADILDKKLKTLSLEALKKDDVLLNVCQKMKIKPFVKAKIIHIALQDLRNSLSQLPKDKNILVYCGSGYAAYLAYCLLSAHGFKNVFLLNSPDVWQ